jgi:4-amino-4-deoxy-L-arabinose transferase-like glycosyltransferase
VAPNTDGARPPRRAAALFALVYFALACFCLPDFGPTWDIAVGSYPYGDKLLAWVASDTADFVEFVESGATLESRRPYPAIGVRAFEWFKVYPLGATLGAVSTRVLWHWLGVVPAVAARHVVVPAGVAVLVYALIVFVGRRTTLATGLAGAALLVSSPRFFTHSLTNVKDALEAVLYTLALLALYRALLEHTLRSWLLVGIASALALAQKANGLVLPIHGLAILVAGRIVARERVAVSWKGVACALLGFVALYVAVSPALWHDPLARVGKMLDHATRVGTTSTLDGLLAPRRDWMVRFASVVNATITTPIPVLLLAVVGLFARGAPLFLRVFLAIGALLPPVRLLLPGLRDFDGVRHFLEFYPATCALAGIGLLACIELGARRLPRVPWRVLVPAAALAPGVLATIATYPYGTCYFNGLVGGLSGAQARGVPQSTDYWAASYWHGAAWLNENADPGACLHVPIAANVVDVIAPVRLRADIAVNPAAPEDCAGAVYVMYVTRRDFYRVLAPYLDAHATPVHEVRVQGAVILRIFRFATDEERRELRDVLGEERVFNRLRALFIDWVQEDPARRDLVFAAMAVDAAGDRAEAVRRFRAALPLLDERQAVIVIEWLQGISI